MIREDDDDTKTVVDSTLDGPLDVEGDLEVHGGIIRGAIVYAEGSIRIGFANDAEVHSKGDMIIETYAMNSIITSDGMLTIPRGRLIGGVCKVADLLRVGELGSRSAVSTKVVIGEHYNAKVKEVDSVLEPLRKKRQAIDRDIGARTTLASLSKRPELRSNPEKLQEILDKIRFRDEAAAAIPDLRELRKEYLKKAKEGRVVVQICAYPGAVVSICGEEYKFTQRRDACELWFEPRYKKIAVKDLK